MAVVTPNFDASVAAIATKLLSIDQPTTNVKVFKTIVFEHSIKQYLAKTTKLITLKTGANVVEWDKSIQKQPTMPVSNVIEASNTKATYYLRYDIDRDIVIDVAENALIPKLDTLCNVAINNWFTETFFSTNNYGTLTGLGGLINPSSGIGKDALLRELVSRQFAVVSTALYLDMIENPSAYGIGPGANIRDVVPELLVIHDENSNDMKWMAWDNPFQILYIQEPETRLEFVLDENVYRVLIEFDASQVLTDASISRFISGTV